MNRLERGREMLRFFALMIVAAAVVLALVSGPADRAVRAPLRLRDGRLPNVLLLTVDTLRADHLGYIEALPNDLTPALDDLIRSGTAFLAASTPAPTTRTATAALFTGTYRGKHGVRGNAWTLGKRLPVLGELLRQAGYRTAAFYGNGILGAEYGFGRGFESYESFADLRGRGVSKDEVGIDRALRWLDDRPPEPWLLWVHLMDPHGPYDSAPAEVLHSVDRRDSRPERRLRASHTNTGLGVIPRYQVLPGVRRTSVYRRRYRAEVRHTDAQVKRLLDALDDSGLAADTLVVFTADHGEGLGDHDYFFQHGWFAYEGSIAVPLAFRLPGRVRSGVRVESPVSLVDVAPTILGGLGLAVPSEMQGRDLSPSLSAERAEPIEDGPVFSASTLSSLMAAVRLGRWKLVHTPPPPESPSDEDNWKNFYEAEESFRLYDLARDPGETIDVSAAHPRRTAELKALLTRWEVQQLLVRFDQTEPGRVDARLRELLHSLGYVD